MYGKWIVRKEGGTVRLETGERKPTLREQGGLKDASYEFQKLRKGYGLGVSQR